MTIAQAFNDIAVAHGGTASASGTIAGAIDALNDALAGSDQAAAETIEDAVRLLGAHIGGGSTPTGTIEITENGENIDVAQYAYADVNVSGGSAQSYSIAADDTENGSFVFKLLDLETEQSYGSAITKANAGQAVEIVTTHDDEYQIGQVDVYAVIDPENDTYLNLPQKSTVDIDDNELLWFVMPEHDVRVSVEFYADDGGLQ